MERRYTFFFFGTLQDADLREVVVGSQRSKTESATLRGYSRVRLLSRVQPGLIPDSNAAVEGNVVVGIGLDGAARVSHYEQGAYEVKQVRVGTTDGFQNAWVFLPDPDLTVAPGEWKLVHWQQKYKSRSLRVAQSWMDQLDGLQLDSLKENWRQR